MGPYGEDVNHDLFQGNCRYLVAVKELITKKVRRGEID